MAVKEMTPIKGNLNAFKTFAFETATSASDGFRFKLPRKSDEYVVVLVMNSDSNAHTITVKKPTTGSYAAAAGDTAHSIAAGGYALLRFESARFANNDGTVCLVPDNVAVKAVVLC